MFSANNADALQMLLQSHQEYLNKHPERLAALSYTLGVRREFLPHRAFSVASATRTPDTPLHISQYIKAGDRHDLVYVFTGQGAQWARMGAELIEDNPVFRRTIQKLEIELASCHDPPTWSLMG
jgi:acyl transferase domain-containing protein